MRKLDVFVLGVLAGVITMAFALMPKAAISQEAQNVIVTPNEVVTPNSLSEIDMLLPALYKVESSSGTNLYGDYNKAKYSESYIATLVRERDLVALRAIDPAIGPYQIHWRYWADACRILKVDWHYCEAMNKEKAEKAVKAYIGHYGVKRRLDREPTLKDMALIHNGGPNGYKWSQNPYWNYVKKYLPE